MKEKIIIYSPVDGIVKPIKELGDGVFSEGMLGDGFYVEPTSKDFYSPISKGELVQIFDTKHAYFFKTEEGPTFLMHIGLDTVNLEGKPFKTKIDIGNKVTLETKIVEVNYKLLESKGFSKATPVVLDTNEFKDWKIKLYDLKNPIKHGDPIGEFIWQKNIEQPKKEDISNLSTKEKIAVLLNTKGKYDSIAEQIYNFVGTKSNYTKVFNCMTRLRFDVKEKDLVKESDIKKIGLVKGIVWSGNQIQIVIGGEVYKVKDAVEKYSTNLDLNINDIKNTKKPSLAKRFMVAISGIILPSLPVLMASGLLMGIKAVLVMTEVIVDMNIGLGAINMNVDLFSVFINILSETGLKLLGIFIGYNTMKWLGGPAIMQIFLSLAIAGATLGLGVLPDLTMFDINGFAIKAGIYTSSIIPHIASAFILFYLDKWIKTWMPTSIDVLFRSLISYVVTYAIIFFLAGPILYLLEQGIAQVLDIFGKIPYGIGVAIFAITWQPLVLTGMHAAVIIPLSISVGQGNPSVLILATGVAVFAQVGAVIGVSIRTNNAHLRSIAIATIPGGMVGVTEPILYGVNLPKGRPFIAALIASGVFGILFGLLGVEARTAGGLGIFGFTGQMMDPTLVSKNDTGIISALNLFTGDPNSLVTNTVLWFVLNIGVIPVTALLTFFMYQDRVSETAGIKKVNTQLVKYYSLALGISKSEAKKRLKDNLNLISSNIVASDLAKIKEIEKEIIKVTNSNVKLEKAININEKQKEDIISKIKKLENKKSDQNDIKINNLIAKFEALKDNEKIIELESESIELKRLNIDNMEWLAKWQESVISKIDKIVNKITIDVKKTDLKNIDNFYWNVIHSIDINYLINDEKPKLLNRKMFKQAKTK